MSKTMNTGPNMELIDLLLEQRAKKVSEGSALMAKLGALQAEIGTIDQELRVARSGHLAAEIIAEKQRFLVNQEREKQDVNAQRHAEEQQAKRERAQRVQAYQDNVARQHKERADREAEAENRRRAELAAEGWVT